MIKVINKTSDILDRLSRIIAVPMIASFFLLLLFGVLTRFVLRRPMLGVSDFSKTCFVWSCFLGAAILFKKKEHIAITGFIDMLPQKIRKIIIVSSEVLQFVFFVYVMTLGITVTSMVHVTRMVATKMPMSVLYSALPVSMFICAVHTLANLLTQAHSKWNNIEAIGKGRSI